jgi:hypothetical protein
LSVARLYITAASAALRVATVQCLTRRPPNEDPEAWQRGSDAATVNAAVAPAAAQENEPGAEAMMAAAASAAAAAAEAAEGLDDMEGLESEETLGPDIEAILANLAAKGVAGTDGDRSPRHRRSMN